MVKTASIPQGTRRRREFLETKTTTTTEELKKELHGLLQDVIEESDYGLEATDRAIQSLCYLKKLKQQNILLNAPPEFKCSLSGQFMKDPVFVNSYSQTYDRSSILEWIEDEPEHETCAKILAPNVKLKEKITRWCEGYGIKLEDEEMITENASPAHLNISENANNPPNLISLFGKLSSLNLCDIKMAAKDIRKLSETSQTFRALFGKVTTAIMLLVEPFSSRIADKDRDLHEDLIATIFNLSKHESNRKLIGENIALILALIKALKDRESTIEARSFAARALSSLSVLDSNKTIICKYGGYKALIAILEEEHPMLIQAAALAISNLCLVPDNYRGLTQGTVSGILKNILNPIIRDDLLSILALLSSNLDTTGEMIIRHKPNAVSILLDTMRKNTTNQNGENCIVILDRLYGHYSQTYAPTYAEIRKEEDANGTISQIAQKGISSIAKKKACHILEALNIFECMPNYALNIF